MKLFLRYFIVLIIFSSSSIANEVKVFEFTDKELSELSVRKVRGADNKTIYSVGSNNNGCLLYTSPSPRDKCRSRKPTSA